MTDRPHHIALGSCFACERAFAFNPQRVPSIPIDADGNVARDGDRKPICRDCAEYANRYRKQHGLPLWDTSDAAYEPAEGIPE